MALASKIKDEKEHTIIDLMISVYPSPLMIKSVASLAGLDTRVVADRLPRLERLGVIERKEGSDGRAKYFRVTAWAYSAFRNKD